MNIKLTDLLLLLINISLLIFKTNSLILKNKSFLKLSRNKNLRMSTLTSIENPLLSNWKNISPHGLPPFVLIKPNHYEDAFKIGIEKHLLDIKKIVSDVPIENSNFDNVIAPFDRAGQLFNQISLVFQNLCSSDCPKELQVIQLKLSGPLAAHSSNIYMYPGLFERINEVYNKRFDSSLNPEQIRLIERFHLDFVRAGAKFDSVAQAKYAKIMESLAELETKFTQNVMGDESSYTIVLNEADLSGLPQSIIESAKQAAIDRGLLNNEYVITLSRSLVEPFLTYSDRRDLREKAWKAWTSRGELDPSRNNHIIILEILKLREEQARMHGYNNFAEYATADTMAGSPVAVMDLLQKVWTRGKASVDREREALLEYIRSTSNHKVDVSVEGNSNTLVNKIEPWDWRYYAEKVRQSKYDLDQSEIKPYFSLDSMINAVFDCAKRLFGLTFVHRADIVSYHPDVKTYEVYDNSEGENKLIGLFLHDNYARPNKQGGAWMSEYRCQSRNQDSSGEHVIPIIVNNNNFAKGDPCLLSFDDAVTLFHEFGHGMHGMLSNVTYQRLSGTNVLRDFVELPSQLFEHWLSEKEVLLRHARHYITNEPIPDELLDRLMKAKKFNQGFSTIEFTASALVDQALHTATINPITADHSIEERKNSDIQLNNGNVLTDITLFEKNELAKLGMPDGIVMRHRPTHFQHLFSSSAYAAGYYVYLWAEVLDADGYDAFLETGNPFDPTVARKVRQYIYSSGNSIDPAKAYRLFRGRDPIIEPMLKKKGLLVE